MPGRRDFGILSGKAISDPRVLAAGAAYVALRIARRETAEATVCGHIAQLGIYLARESDDGSMPGDWIGVVRAATLSDVATAARIVDALRRPEVDLITEGPTGLRLRGFAEAYEPLLRSRELGRARAAASRERNANGSRDVTRTVREPPSRAPARAVAGLRAPPARTRAPSSPAEVTRTVRGTFTPTGPDRSSYPPTPASGGGGPSASPHRNGTAHETTSDPPDTADLTAGEAAAGEVIAQAIERGDVRLDPDDELRGIERDLAGADAVKRDAGRARDGNAIAAAEARIADLARRRTELVAQRRTDAATLLRSGAAEARGLLRRWRHSDVLTGPKENRVPLRVACIAAAKVIRADERDRRRGRKQGANIGHRDPSEEAPAS